MFTADPATGDRDRVVIEAAFGLGEVVVGGQVEPDTYVLSKDGPRCSQERIGLKSHQDRARPDGGDAAGRRSPDEERARRVLDDDELLMALARTAIADRSATTASRRTSSGPSTTASRIWIVQSRPITTLAAAPRRRRPQPPGRVLVSGLGASPARAVGPVRVLRSPDGGRPRCAPARCWSRR